MIQISLPTALAFYSAILGVILVAIWAFTEVSVRRSYHVIREKFLNRHFHFMPPV